MLFAMFTRLTKQKHLHNQCMSKRRQDLNIAERNTEGKQTCLGVCSACADGAFLSHEQIESTSQRKAPKSYLSSLCVQSNTSPGKVLHKVWTPCVLVQIYGLAALN